MVCVGDKVRISCEGGIYTTYTNFIRNYVAQFNSEHTCRVADSYREGIYPTADEMAHNFTVEYVAHHDVYDSIIAVVSSERGNVFIYSADALSVVTPVSDIHVGDKVTIIDSSLIYSSWLTLIESQRGVIPDSAASMWKEGALPKQGEQGKVIWVGLHVCRPLEGIVCIVETSSGLYALDRKALGCPDCAWEKYLAYVRNWCTKYKDFAPRSDAGPLSLPDWEREYKVHTLVI